MGKHYATLEKKIFFNSIKQRHRPTWKSIANSAKNLQKNKGYFKIKFGLSTSKGIRGQIASRLGTKSEQTLPPQIKF